MRAACRDSCAQRGLVAFPTETVYGLGANALDAAAVAKIFAAKGRPANNPLIVHVAMIEQARELTAAWPDSAEQLAKRFWPGPLSLVLPKRATVPEIVTAGAATVAIRVPAHPVALGLLIAAGIPLAAPSANRSNQLSPTTAEHVRRSLGDAVEMILDGGATGGGLESTVVDLSGSSARLLRPGLISPSEIEAVIGSIERTVSQAIDHAKALPSPGTMLRHYAPRATMECVAVHSRERVEQLARAGHRVGWLTFAENGLPLAPEIATRVSIRAMPAQPSAYAAMLYAELHALDQSGVDRIVVELPPEEEAWLAMRDRLWRGSTAEEK